MSKHTVKFDGGRYSVLCDGVVVDELPLHQETEQLRAELDAARDAERAATEAWKRLLGDEAKARAELDAARRLRERIAKTMGSEPDDDDDLVECVRIAVEQLDAANARVKELEEALADAQRVPLLSPELESANRHLQAANADRARLRETLREMTMWLSSWRHAVSIRAIGAEQAWA